MRFDFKFFLLVVAVIFFTSFNACKKATKTEVEPPVPEPPVVVVIPPPTFATVKTWLVDKNATDETAALFYNMKTLAKTKIMFGHQDDTKQGTNWDLMQSKYGDSDVKDVTGAYPAVYGWDFMNIATFQQNSWFNEYADVIRNKTMEAYKRGGVNTYSWHYWNPVLSKNTGAEGSPNGNNASFYYKDAKAMAVPEILPGGNYNAVYKQSLGQVAAFIKTLVDDNGKPIPIIFRPFHEFDGDWFWWGAAYCTPQQYKDLFQYTVKYLRDEKQLHNLLFSWSPDRSYVSEEQYLSRYPGDDYVDVLGIDNYYDLQSASTITIASNKLKVMSDYAIKNNKIAALTETGLKNLTQSDWYTAVLLKTLQQQKIEISYALAWANSQNGYWTPYKGHPAEADFIKFKNNPSIVFEDKLPKMYMIK